MSNRFKYLSQSKGFSLIELGIVLFIIAILGTSFIPIVINQVQIKAGEKTALEMSIIEEASRSYYVNNGSWPGDVIVLQTGGYLNSSWVINNPWGNPYQITSIPLSLTVSTQVPVKWARLIASSLPSTTINNDVVSSSVSIPGASSENVPSGLIAMWSGVLADVPSGWKICDGTNDTPDLRDKFILATSAGENPGATGGSLEHIHTGTTSVAGSHDHLTASGVTLSNNQFVRSNPWGTETVGSPAEYFIGFDGRYDNGGSSYSAYRTSSAGDHNHTFTANSASNVPPYYKLAFIMKG